MKQQLWLYERISHSLSSLDIVICEAEFKASSSSTAQMESEDEDGLGGGFNAFFVQLRWHYEVKFIIICNHIEYLI